MMRSVVLTAALAATLAAARAEAPATQPASQPAPAAEHKDKKVEMAKCRKCGVNFPAFMHNCPNCNEPRH